tara:strand:- start:874 stop:1518 length:645 start_codon:yes stop_codon:yes gene_type:complete
MLEMNTLGIKALENYAEIHTKSIHPLLEELKQITIERTEAPQMMIGSLEGKFLQLICALSNAKNIVEVGTFTGYSTLCLADAVGPDGHVVTIDCNQETSKIAQEFISRAGFQNRVTFVIGDAMEVLSTIDTVVDLAFIDADKIRYDLYYETLLPYLKPAGFLIFDNMLWNGRVLHPQTADDHALNDLNKKLTQDTRVENFLLPLRDGIQVVQKL